MAEPQCAVMTFSLFSLFSFWCVFLEIKIALYFHLFHETVTNSSTNSLLGGKVLLIIVKHIK